MDVQQTGLNDRFVDHPRWTQVVQQTVIKIITIIAMILVRLCRAA
jgi:hypothetical protein